MPNYPIYAEPIHRWLSSLDQRLSPLRATDSSQFDQNENVLRRSSPTILYNVASNENIILQRSCARRVFLREKRSRFLGQENALRVADILFLKIVILFSKIEHWLILK